MQKLLIADSSAVFAEALEGALQEQFEIVTCADGMTLQELLPLYQPDILILNLMLPYKDGLTVLQESVFHPSVILAITTHLSAYTERSILSLGIDYTMIAPAVDTVVLRLQDLIRQYTPQAKTMSLEERAAYHLKLLNFPNHLDGYRQLCLALPMYADNPRQLLTKELYPDVAKRGDFKDGRSVEHSIRKAIYASWMHRDNAVWRKYFSFGPDGTIPCPSNKVFLCRLAEILLSQDRML